MKTKLSPLLLFAVLISCTSDEHTPSINIALLYGQWFNNNICPTQNNLVFNNDGSYIRTYSGNPCDANENDTYQYTGTYTIDGNSIAFNLLTGMVIEEGTANPLTDSELVKLINQKIITLTETELTIEREFDMEPIYRNWYYTKE